jgi:DNA-binding transcriptional ArsR family regulator
MRDSGTLDTMLFSLKAATSSKISFTRLIRNSSLRRPARFPFPARGRGASFRGVRPGRIQGQGMKTGRREPLSCHGRKDLAKRSRDHRAGRPPRLALRQSLRVRIVAACCQRKVTPKEIADQEGLPPEAVNYHFRALVRDGYIYLCEKEQARGFRRHFYTAVRRAAISDREFAQMAAKEQHEVSKATFRDFRERYEEAYEAGTLEASRRSHRSCDLLRLDDQAWGELMPPLSQTLEAGFEINSEAQGRLQRSRAEPIPTTVILAGFECDARYSSSGRASPLQELIGCCSAALRSGKLDARSDSHLTWCGFHLDEQGWRDQMIVLLKMRRIGLEIASAAKPRLRKRSTEAIPTLLGLAAFQSPAKDPAAAGEARQPLDG